MGDIIKNIQYSDILVCGHKKNLYCINFFQKVKVNTNAYYYIWEDMLIEKIAYILYLESSMSIIKQLFLYISTVVMFYIKIRL